MSLTAPVIDQGDLDFTGQGKGGLTRLDREFLDFHAENPRVYEVLARLARGMLHRGHDRIGIGMLWEVMRWQFLLGTNDPDFKLNNNHRSRFARLLMDQEPDLRRVFEIRALKS